MTIDTSRKITGVIQDLEQVKRLDASGSPAEALSALKRVTMRLAEVTSDYQVEIRPRVEPQAQLPL